MNLMYQLPKLNVKLLTIVTLFTLLFGGLAMVNTSFAQGTDPVPADGGEVVDPTNPTTGPGSGGFNLGEGVFWNILTRVIYFFFVSIPVSIASYAGQIFNLAIGYLVISMGQLINVSSGIGFAINQLWTVIRDVMNILFIFALIYLGIKIILYSEDSGTRRALGQLIAAALLVNFSLLITKTIIDFSNIAAYEIFLILGGPAATAAGAGAATYSGISGAFFSATGVQQIVSGATTLSNGGVTNWEMFVNLSLLMFMTAILFIVLTVVFIGGAAMIFVRFIALILYMIFSPVMFLGWVLPSFKKYQDNWWNGFFKKAFFAPAFLFMLYLSLITITQLRAGLDELGLATATANYQAAINGDSGAIGIFLVYCFAIGMLVASVLVAQQMGATGANATMGALKGMRNGVQSFAGRRTVGAYGNWLAKVSEEDEKTRMGRVRNRLRTAATLGTFDTQSRIKTGKAMANNTFGGSRSYTSQEAYGRERTATIAGGKKQQDLLGTLKAWDKDPNKPENIIAMESALGSASASDLATLAKSDEGRALLVGAAGSIDQSKWDKMLEDKDLAPAHRKALGSGRQASVKVNLVKPDPSLSKDDPNNKPQLKFGIKNAKTDEINALDFKDDVLANAKYLQAGQMDGLEKKWGPQKFRLLQERWEKDLLESTPEEAVSTRKNNKEIALLPKDMFTRDDKLISHLVGAGKMNADLMGKIASESKADKKIIGRHVIDNYGASANLRNLPPDLYKFFTNGPGVQFLPDDAVIL